ncbi:MAG: DUF6048 family protein [Cellulophaga sp.]
MLKSFISICLVLSCFNGLSQNETTNTTTEKKPLQYKEAYGLRVGVDLSKVLRSYLSEDYTGLEFSGDYRINQKLYVAAELGNEKKTMQEDLYNFTASGSYLKLGVDYNNYSNWYGMSNSIFFGGRYAMSSFSQTLNNYSLFNSNRYWQPENFVPGSDVAEEFKNRNASWIECILGTKVELFANFYLGASVRLSYLVSNSDSDRFPNLYIPGFNKVTDGSKFGSSLNYSLSYFIPIYKKAKSPKKKKGKPENK